MGCCQTSIKELAQGGLGSALVLPTWRANGEPPDRDPRPVRNRDHFLPSSKRTLAKSSIVLGPQMMTPDHEKVGYLAMHRQKPLRLSLRLEAPHLALPLPRSLMGNLCPIVGVLLYDMRDRRHHRSLRRRITSELVGDDSYRTGLLALEQLPKESRGCPCITPFLHENIDDVTVLVDGAPKVVELAPNLDEDFVQVPDVTLLPAPPLEFSGIFWPELHAPLANRFIADLDASFR